MPVDFALAGDHIVERWTKVIGHLLEGRMTAQDAAKLRATWRAKFKEAMMSPEAMEQYHQELRDKGMSDDDIVEMEAQQAVRTRQPKQEEQ